MSFDGVTVIMPVLDRERLVGQALDSLFAQTRPPDEVIVVDDGSTDGTVAVVDRYRDQVALLRTERAGPAAARNAGLAAAAGDLIAFLDSDDLWPKDRLATQMEVLRGAPAMDAAWGMSEIVLMDGGALPTPAWNLSAAFNVTVCAMLFRRRVLDAAEGFSPSLRFGEDSDLLLRARSMGFTFQQHQDVVLYYRRHAGNMTNDSQAAFRGAWFDIARLSMQRRRLDREAKR
jgi:glycosyltransferase involved in cell wall biosynthesis